MSEDSGNLAKMEISNSVNIFSFATERQKEIIAMTNSIKNPATTKLIFQKLPPHMRRRVMSHNSKRLPIRLREGHMNQLAKSGLPPASKRPSRNYRRRHRNHIVEYNRRQQTKRWLETHIWHAKRFHMVERWGYKLAEASCDKAFKAAFRATSEHCLLQDISYCRCIQLSGCLEDLLSELKNITKSSCGYTFASRAFLNGNREGTVEIFHNDGIQNAIGKVNYMWNPEITENHRMIWIFIHPSYYKEVLELLIKLFSVSCIKLHNNDSHSNNGDTNIKKDNEDTDRNYVPVYTNSKGVKLVELMDLNRFRLTGPLSNSVLYNSLKQMTELPESNESFTDNWAHEYFKKNSTEIIDKQSQVWNALRDISVPSELASHMVMGINMLDPRLQQNRKRTKVIAGNGEIFDLTDISDCLHHSALWNDKIRERIAKDMLSNAELCKKRNKLCLVPGEDGYLSNFTQCIPILLIQRPGVQTGKVGYGSGWDILIPPKYAIPVWLSFVMHGARTGGLRESRNICFESQQHYLCPDTKAGKTEDIRIYHELRNKYFKMPPDKRVNYIKLGINSPFMCHWQLLVDEWCDVPQENFHVLRDVSLLKNLQIYLKNKVSIDLNIHLNYIIPVSLSMANKGICKKFSIICLPEAQDMKNYRLMRIMNESDCFIEKIHADENQRKRHDERQAHLTLLKRLKRKRILARKALQAGKKDTTSTKQMNSEKLITAQLKKMRELWLPETISTVRNQCSRQVMGYVTHGGFSFTQHKGMCLGFVTTPSIVLLRQLFKNNIVLVRNTTSRKYFFASLNILQ